MKTATQAPQTPKITTVALFGGSFNPVHHTHLAIARAALAQLKPDAFWFLPAGQPWQKAPLAANAAQRIEMLRLALEEAQLRQCRIEPYETLQSGPTKTLTTLQALSLSNSNTQWQLIIGGDQAANFHTWHDWRGILTLAKLVVVQRASIPITFAPEVAKSLAGNYLTLTMPPSEVSSSQIRALLTRGAAAAHITGLPASVATYIKQAGLYAAKP